MAEKLNDKEIISFEFYM